MKIAIKIAMILAVVSLLVGIISRFTLAPVSVTPGTGISA